MSPASHHRRKGAKGESPAVPLRLAAVGLESEFELLLDGRQVRPEKVFASPRDFIRGPLMHRQGTSYHLPTGGAIYFDTGVIEVATPLVEIDRGCVARAGRSLWEGIHLVRRELDDWQRRAGHEVRLRGFSAHYNVSFSPTPAGDRSVERLARVLAFVLPAPVILLATNRRSNGVGVRPRGDRVEVTVDFTPSPALMIATGTVITGIARAIMAWPEYRLSALAEHEVPVLAGFRPRPHTSRKGWLGRGEDFPHDPWRTDPDAEVWEVRGRRERASLRQVALEIFHRFRFGIRRVSDPFTLRLIEGVLSGHAPSLLDLPDRPEAYDDVGRLCFWDDLFPPGALGRSLYERVLIRAINGHRLVIGGRHYDPLAMRGWAQVVFRRDDGARQAFSLDYLVRHLEDWERQTAAPGLRGRSAPRPRS